MELNNNNDSFTQQYPSLEELIITNQPINDQYIYLLYHQLKELKRERKQKEYETTVLTGRVNCLKQEEEKTLKKLELTKKKTSQKIMSIEGQKLKLERELKLKEQNKKEMAYRKQKNKEQRDSFGKSVMVKETKIQHIIMEARMVRQQHKSTEEYLKSIREKEIENKKYNNEKIKSQSVINNEKKRVFHLEKKSKIKAGLENKIEIELMIKEENDKRIKAMQIAEEDIIRRIKETTEMHKICK